MIHENSVGKTEISMMIARHQYIKAVTRLLKRNHVVAILGARQVGKTTYHGVKLPRHSDRHPHGSTTAPLDRKRPQTPDKIPQILSI